MVHEADPKGVQAVERALAVLAAFSPSRQELDARELTQALNVHQSTLYRLLGALQRHQLIDWDNGKVRPGLRLYELGCLAIKRWDIKLVAQPVLFSYAAQVEATFSLGIYNRSKVLYLDRVENPHNVPVVAVAGGVGPVHCTGTGKVLLAAQSPEEMKRVISAGLQRYTQYTVTDGALLEEELGRVRQQGYALTNQELQLGDYGIAAPVYDSTGKVLAAISVSGSVSRISQDQGRYVQAILDAAAEISRRMGYSII